MSPREPVPAARIVFSSDDRAEIAARIDAALQSGALTLGTNTAEFEAEFARTHDAAYAVAVSSGTAALEIVLRSLTAIGHPVAGRDVIVPANTFAATVFAVQGAGGRPVLADISSGTYALSVQTIEAAFTPNTAAVVLVHIGGFVTPEIGAIRTLCDARGVVLVEDAAHAHGVTYGGRFAGSFGTAATFSFYPTKVITSGEGGMIVTADERLNGEALAYRDQGKAGFVGNLHVRQGYAWRMSELHAAVGLVHLRRLAGFLAVRRRLAARYTAGLTSIPQLTPYPVDPEAGPNFYKYPALLADGIDRPALKDQLKRRFGVSLSGEVYETPLHLQPVFRPLAKRPLPVAEHVCARHVCLPLHSDMTDDEADRVLSALSAVLPAMRG